MDGYRGHHGLMRNQSACCRSLRILGAVVATWLGLASSTLAQPEDFRPVAYRHSASLSEAEAIPSPDKQACFAILGAVKNSGVYQAAGAPITLGQLVSEAGGLSTTASPMAHIIRGSGPVKHVMFRPGSSVTIQHGDVVVFHRIAGPSPDDIVMTAEGIPAVHVAFINLLPDRPVVVPLDLSMASLAGVQRALSQPAGFSAGVRLYRQGSYESPQKNLDSQMPLLPGDVLLFPAVTPELAQAASAIGLPAAMPMEGSDQAHEPDSEQGLAAPASPDLTSELTISGPMDLGSMDDPSPAHRSVEPIATSISLAPSGGATLADAFAPPIPESVDAAAQGDAIRTYDAPAPPREDLHWGTLRAGVAKPKAVNPTRSSMPLTTLPRASAKRAETDSATSVGGLAGVVLALSLLCFAVSLIWSRYDREPTTAIGMGAATHDLHSPSTRNELDELIENRIPLVEEETRLPEGLSYCGQAIGRRRLILNQRETLAGPHISLSAPAPRSLVSDTDDQRIPVPTVDLSGDSIRIDAEPTSAADDKPRDAAHKLPQPQPQRGLLERVLVAMEREKRQ